ncbi:MAG TPA: 1-acyl-sn-glycerol-3-phosphate acyltransferase [Candidatus Coprenecus pullistercoris]|nr:1-acyl-sn-glycerol-3-phosphate acyltransferase [Candidatus Coprenecus pullistercoris]
MNRLFLYIYDRLSGHRTLAWLILAVTVGLLCLSAAGMRYEEDISDFLPSDPQSDRYSSVYKELSDQGRIAVVFRAEADVPADSLYRAAEVFGRELSRMDTASLVAGVQVRQDASAGAIIDFAASSLLYMTAPDELVGLDSLLEDSAYIDACMENLRLMMMLPGSGTAAGFVRHDPLRMFSPALMRLRAMAPDGGFEVVDGFVTASDGSVLVFVDSPFGGSETGHNKALAALIDGAMDSTAEKCPAVRVSAAGAPLIAVANADRIRKDTWLSASIAMAVILLLLAVSFRKPGYVLWTFIPVAFGLCFAVGIMALVKGSVSLVVIGIGTVVVGIAVNYPLHYLDYLKYVPTGRDVLRDITAPLLTGNITTVSAFLCLLFLKAEAMRDLGLFGALTLVGTILFVLIFMPVLTSAESSRKTARPLFIRGNLRLPAAVRRAVFAAVVLLTVFFAIRGRHVPFDSDLMNINYMTPSQKEDMELLASAVAPDDSLLSVFAVAQGRSLDEALEANERMVGVLSDTDTAVSVRGLYGLIPSQRRQRETLRIWSELSGRHPDLAERLRNAAAAQGLPAVTIKPFSDLLESVPQVVEEDYFEPLLAQFRGTYVLESDSLVRIVNTLRAGGDEVDAMRAAVEKSGVPGAMVFSSDDVGNRLVSVLSGSFDFVGAVCSIVVFIFLCMSFGRIETAVIAFVPLATGWVWILGIMDLTGMSFNIVNVILAAFIFGQGDDYTIFVTDGLMHEYTYGKKILAPYKDSVLLSAAIMFVAVGMLVLAEHPALRSLAGVTAAGMAVVVLMAFYLPPLMFRWLTQRHGRSMDVPITLRSLLYSAWALLFYLFSSFFVLLPLTWFYFLVSGRSSRTVMRYHSLMRRVCGFVIRRVPGAGFSLSNPAGETFDRPAVIIANHQSDLDLMCVMMLTSRMIILTNARVYRNPLYSWIIHRLGFLSVAEGIDNIMPRIREAVRNGYSVMVFPEGTRSADCSLGRFHKGAFHIAKECGLDIVPVYIHGAGHVLPKKSPVLRRGSIHVEVGGRIPYSEAASFPSSVKLTSYVRGLFAARYGEICAERENVPYFMDYVRHKYIYKGRAVASECDRKLRAALLRRDVIENIPGNVRTLRLDRCGQGETAWLTALVHGHVQVYACVEDEDRYLIAANTPAVPSNLHFVRGDMPAGAPVPDMVLDMGCID